MKIEYHSVPTPVTGSSESQVTSRPEISESACKQCRMLKAVNKSHFGISMWSSGGNTSPRLPRHGAFFPSIQRNNAGTFLPTSHQEQGRHVDLAAVEEPKRRYRIRLTSFSNSSTSHISQGSSSGARVLTALPLDQDAKFHWTIQHSHPIHCELSESRMLALGGNILLGWMSGQGYLRSSAREPGL